MLEIKFTTTMKRNVKRLKKQGKNIAKLQTVLGLLADENTLPPQNRDHALIGNQKAYRECYIEPDWLLVYQIKQSELILLAAATGSHADLFGK